MSTVALTRSELVAMLAELRDAFVKNQSYRQTPLGRLVGKHLDELRFDGYSPKTVRNREQTLAWFCFDNPELALEDVTYEQLRGFLEAHWASAAPNTKAQHVSSLRTFFEWASDFDHIPTNPARKLRPPRLPDTERRSHPVATIRKLVLAQEMRRDRIAILLMYWCALRRNELRVVQFRHIDLSRRVLTVFGKGGTVLEQHIPEEVALLLERYIQDEDPRPDEYLLYPYRVGRRGAWPNWRTEIVWEDRLSPYKESGIDRWFQRCRGKAGLEETETRIVMHELRHSAGTHAQQEGHDLLATQHLLRHKSAAVTERFYIHVDQRQSVARITRIMPNVLEDED